jgi:hypothetical protein
VIDGIIEGVRESGGNVTEATKAAVKGAIETGADLGKLAAQAVKQVLAGVAEGMEEIAKARSKPSRGKTAKAAH